MLRPLVSVLLLSAVCASPALAQRSAPTRTHPDLRVPDMFRAPGDDAEPRSEMRTPEVWRTPAPPNTPRRRALSADLVVPDIFRRPGDPPSARLRRRELRTPGGWPPPEPRSAGEPEPAQPAEGIADGPLSELVERAERDGGARVGDYVFTRDELRAALTYLGGGVGVAAFVQGAGAELLERARARGNAPPAPPTVHLGRALDRP